MKAIIMAGGEGTRLRPLTCDCPKPMIRLMERPIIDYALELLSLHGISEAAVTLGYLPERIRDRLGDESHGISLRYYTEYRPLGTAGGVKQARDFLDETFCVLSGDGVTDCDLTSALEFHRSTGAKATVVLKNIPDPTAYGIVIAESGGRIRKFTEKPSWGEVVSDAVNTGIYIFEPDVLDMIPDGQYDFGNQLLPELARRGMLYGWTMDGYWCDVGDTGAYLGMCRDALDGLIALPSLAKRGSFIHPDAHISNEAHIESPCYIGKGAVISRGATIGAHSIIGSNAQIGEGASIKRSVIWDSAVIGDGAHVRCAVIGKAAKLSTCARVYENCVLGTGARLGIDSETAPGVCIWPGKSVADATLADSNVVWGANTASCFRNGTISVEYPGDALRGAQAYAGVFAPRELLLGRSASPTAAAVWHSCAAGLMAQGVSVIDAGICTEPQLRYTMSLMHTDCAIYVNGDSITPLYSVGIRIDHTLQRRVCALISRQDYPCPFSSEPCPIIYSGSSEKAYTAMLADAFCADPALAGAIAVHCENQLLLSIAEKAFYRAGLNARFEWEDELMELFPGETGIWLSPDGAHARFSHASGMLTSPQNELLIAWTAIEQGETELVVSGHAPRAISEIAQRRSVKIAAAGAGSASLEHALADKPHQLRLHTDGIYLALSAISALTSNALTLTGWISTMPRVQRVEKRVRMDDSIRGHILRKLSENSPLAGELYFERGNSQAWISPMDDAPECRIVSEAYDMEAARELCDFCESELQRAIENIR